MGMARRRIRVTNDPKQGLTGNRRKRVMTINDTGPQQSNFPKMSAPALRALNNAGYTHLEQLTGVTEAEIKKLHGMGPNALGKLQVTMNDAGLSFAEAGK
jgi:hypothetical protein